MRCYICDLIDAEYHDPRDDKYFCGVCHEENTRTAWEQDTVFRFEDEEDPWVDEEFDWTSIEDTSELP